MAQKGNAGSMDRQRDFAFNRHMSDQEALMWNIEKDPWMNPSGALLTLLDQPADFDLLTRRIRYGLARLPRLRERVVPGLGRLSPPVWATDADFDPDYHVRRLCLPAPGSKRQLLDLVTHLYEEPYDRTRPLWMFYAIDGIEDGTGALFIKQHHAVADGIGALRMAEIYTDLERDPPPPPDVDLDKVFADAISAERRDVIDAGGDVSTSIVDTAVRTVTHNVRRQQGIALRAAGDVFKLVSNPARVPRSLIGTFDQLRTTFEATSAGRAIHASAPLWTNRSRRRHLETLRLPLEDAKTAAKKLGGSLNDLFVTGAAMGALAYHHERDTPVEALNMTFVVSTRADRAMGGNAFTPVPVQVAGQGPQSIEERFEQIRDLVAERRRRVSGGGAMSAVAGIANLLPTSMTARVARQQASRIDLATSNLRGAPFPTYIAGAAVVAGIPLGPVAGTAGNLTTLSQNGWLDMGLLVDPAAIMDPAGLARNIDDSYRDLLAAGGVDA